MPASEFWDRGFESHINIESILIGGIMACLSGIHKELNSDGYGQCSVPMWMNGMPAGFCDDRAFGKQTKEYLSRESRYFTPAFCSGLACKGHGGPECPGIKLTDGNYTGCEQSAGDCPTCGH